MRKTFDRFNGVSEQELYTKTLNDRVDYNLDIIFVNINPGLYSAFKGHHYSGPGNHFYRCVYESGLTNKLLKSTEDIKLLDYRIGLMNMFEKPSPKTVQDLNAEEVRQAQINLNRKIKFFKPKIVAFNGKSIYETYIGTNVKSDFNFGKQPTFFDNNSTNIIMFVLPSSSARCSQLPKVIDKVPFYTALRKLREHLNGLLPGLTDLDIMFPDFKVAMNTGAVAATDIKIESEFGSDFDKSNDNEDEFNEENEITRKKNEHKIKFVRLNNLPYSHLPSNIIENLNEQRKTKKGITITTDKNLFNMKVNNNKNSHMKPGSLASDVDTASNLTNDDSLSDQNSTHNNNNSSSISAYLNESNGNINEKQSNIGSIVLNLVSNGNNANGANKISSTNSLNHTNTNQNKSQSNQNRSNLSYGPAKVKKEKLSHVTISNGNSNKIFNSINDIKQFQQQQQQQLQQNSLQQKQFQPQQQIFLSSSAPNGHQNFLPSINQIQHIPYNQNYANNHPNTQFTAYQQAIAVQPGTAFNLANFTTNNPLSTMQSQLIQASQNPSSQNNQPIQITISIPAQNSNNTLNGNTTVNPNNNNNNINNNNNNNNNNIPTNSINNQNQIQYQGGASQFLNVQPSIFQNNALNLANSYLNKPNIGSLENGNSIQLNGIGFSSDQDVNQNKNSLTNYFSYLNYQLDDIQPQQLFQYQPLQ